MSDKERLYEGQTNAQIVVRLDRENQAEMSSDDLATASQLKVYYKDEDDNVASWDAIHISGTTNILIVFSVSIPVPSAGWYKIWAKFTDVDGKIAYGRTADLQIYSVGT